MLKIIKIGCFLTELFKKTKGGRFFGTQCIKAVNRRLSVPKFLELVQLLKVSLTNNLIRVPYAAYKILQ